MYVHMYVCIWNKLYLLCIFFCLPQCVCMVVDAACKKNCDSFQTLLDNLLTLLHTHVSHLPCMFLFVLILYIFLICHVVLYIHAISLYILQACAPVDMYNNVSLKNHNEILRCFAVVSKFQKHTFTLHMHAHTHKPSSFPLFYSQIELESCDCISHAKA